MHWLHHDGDDDDDFSTVLSMYLNKKNVSESRVEELCIEWENGMKAVVNYPSWNWSKCNLSFSFVSKIGDKVVDTRLSKHTSVHNLLHVFLSAYHPSHSTETVVIYVVNTMDEGHGYQGNVGALVFLYLSAAFDTVDHHILRMSCTNTVAASSPRRRSFAIPWDYSDSVYPRQY
jgi:hypothetical protein